MRDCLKEAGRRIMFRLLVVWLSAFVIVYALRLGYRLGYWWYVKTGLPVPVNLE